MREQGMSSVCSGEHNVANLGRGHGVYGKRLKWATTEGPEDGGPWRWQGDKLLSSEDHEYLAFHDPYFLFPSSSNIRRRGCSGNKRESDIAGLKSLTSAFT